MGEIELGSSAAYLAMAVDGRPGTPGQEWDAGITMMAMYRMFEVDACYEQGRKFDISTVGPWGPWGDGLDEITDEELLADEESARRSSEWAWDREMDRKLRIRPK